MRARRGVREVVYENSFWRVGPGSGPEFGQGLEASQTVVCGAEGRP